MTGAETTPGGQDTLDDLGQRSLVLAIGLDDDVSQPVLGDRIGNRPQERERAPLAVDRVLPCWKRHVLAPVPPLPDREADKLQAIERTAGEVQFGVGQLAGGGTLFVRRKSDGHLCLLETMSI